MFVDKVQVSVQAGDGGNGAVSFRHEKFIDRGGPDGGNGGNGGNVVFVASRNQNTLATFRYQKLLKAEPGDAGSKRRRHGKSASPLLVKVPVGTVITDENGDELADLTQDNQETVIARGGKGGFGNAHFVSSTRQAPRLAEKGEPGQKLDITLELKMIADVGLIGLPNAGKSTLLAAISNARPEIANYPFTTLRPNLGMVDIDKENTLLFADIPGLIEGAAEGKGLGDEFLRHVERTSVLIHLIDIYHDDIAAAYKTINGELKAYKVDLTKTPQVIVLSKTEGLTQDIIDEKLAELNKVLPKKTPVFTISGQSGQGIKELLYATAKVVGKQRAKQAKKKSEEDLLPILRIDERREESWKVEIRGSAFNVSGAKIETFAGRTDFSNPHGVQRLRDIIRKMGILRELERQGIESGQTITIGPHHLKY